MARLDVLAPGVAGVIAGRESINGLQHLGVNFSDAMFDSQLEDMILEMLDESAPILVNSMKTTVKSIVKEKNSGAVKNIKASKARKAKNGAYIVNAYTQGKTDHFYYNGGRKVPVYHDDALKWLEYGREGQPARPWVEKATRHAKNEIYAKMQSVYNSKIGM